MALRKEQKSREFPLKVESERKKRPASKMEETRQKIDNPCVDTVDGTHSLKHGN